MGVVREKESGGWENCGREGKHERGRVGEEREKESTEMKDYGREEECK